MMKFIPVFCLFICIMVGCQKTPSAPKPRAYPRVEYPSRNYVEYTDADCPFHFEYPDYAEITKKKENCYFDLYMPSFDARLHCSYVPVENKAKYDDLISDVYKIADRINERANYMEESRLVNRQGVSGVMMHSTGPAASPIHFFLTDTTAHFFTASLYFNSKVRSDSLQPITKFIEEDINHMISTFDWGGEKK